jgi:hypothetical protein
MWVEGHEGGMKRGRRRTGSRSYKNVAAAGTPNEPRGIRVPAMLGGIR